MYVSYVKLNQICKEEFWILCRKMQYLTFSRVSSTNIQNIADTNSPSTLSSWSNWDFSMISILRICATCVFSQFAKSNLNSDHLRFLVVDFEFAYSGFKQEEDFRNAIPVGGGVSSFEICLRSGFWNAKFRNMYVWEMYLFFGGIWEVLPLFNIHQLSEFWKQNLELKN